MRGRDNTWKNMGSEVKLCLGSHPCCCLRQAVELKPLFPQPQKGLIVLIVKGNGKDWHRISAR